MFDPPSPAHFQTAVMMHIDGLQAVHAAAGDKVTLQKYDQLGGQSVIVNHKYRDLAPKPPDQAGA
ncbi:MAG: hypothetical protein EBR09_08205 [Proteobacteria bacterium]|nr:hypothetical protein [Pseudomonadota bacterium]